MFGDDPKFTPKDHTHRSKHEHNHHTKLIYNEIGYKVVTSIVIAYGDGICPLTMKGVDSGGSAHNKFNDAKFF